MFAYKKAGAPLTDFTFVSAAELEEAAENYAEFKKAGAELLSVSTDTGFVHNASHVKLW